MSAPILVPVPSFSRPGTAHLLTIEPAPEGGPVATSCTCEAGQRGLTCIHASLTNDPDFRRRVYRLWRRYRAERKGGRP